MRGEVLFEKMTGISDEFIAEAALVAPVGVAAPKKRPFASLSRALNSGWGVACICLLLAIAAVVSILHWGLPGASVNPFPPAVDPNAPRYVYSMGSLHSFSHGESVDRPVERGEDIYLTVSVQNNGPAFQIRDSEWAQLSAVCVLQGDDSVTLEWRYSPRDGCNQPYWVQTGATETLGFVLTIPENATPGVYDLVLSYDGVKQVFGGALTVEEATETYPPAEEGHVFSFGYEPFGGFAIPGDRVSISCWTINDGAAFTYTGYPDKYAPVAYLIHSETGDMIQGNPAPVDYAERENITVKEGEIAGKAAYLFSIPANATTGEYDLELSYGGASQKFEGVLTVAEPTVEAPAILYNLTLPIGSDWLYEPIDEAYVDGEEVTVRIKFATDVGTLFFLNGEVINAVTGDDQLGYWEYSFIMPQKDSEIIFHTYDGTAPYSGMLKDYILEHPRIEHADLQYYYGEYGDGAMVALLGGGVYGQLETETIVGGYSFWTHEVIPIMVWQDGIFYELPEAYKQGIITDEHLADIFALHKTRFRSYYDDD